MRRSGKGSGGGIGMNKNVRVGVRTGRGGKAQSPAAVNQLGAKVGDHTTGKRGSSGYRGEELVRGPGYNPAPGFGNAVALNVGGGGPGTGRTVMRSGSQQTHGAPAAGSPMPKAKEIWPGWKD
jgi:hypothetical protein